MKKLLVVIIVLISSASFAENDFSVPPGYTAQILEPSGILIAKPKDWYYNKVRDNYWIISKEDSSNNNLEYDTGLKVMISKPEGTTAKEMAYGFLDFKKDDPKVKILNICDESEAGPFQTICIEAEEGAIYDPEGLYHVKYLLFWLSNNDDFIIVQTFGAPANKWDEAKEYQAVMSGFKLIDITRLQDIYKN